MLQKRGQRRERKGLPPPCPPPSTDIVVISRPCAPEESMKNEGEERYGLSDPRGGDLFHRTRRRDKDGNPWHTQRQR
jgi:hypothetical protein